MELKRNTFPILTILISYMLPTTLFLPISIFFLGYIEICSIIGFGFINTLIIFYNFKLKLIPSIIIGYFISTISLILIYLLWLLRMYSNPLIGIIVYSTFSILFLYFIRQKEWKFNSKRKFITLSIFTIVSIVIATNLKDMYPQESNDLKLITFKTVDINQNPLPGDTVLMYRERSPLFNLMELHKVAALVTDTNGEFKIKLSERSNYEFALKRNYKVVYVSSADLKEKNYFLLKFE